MHNPTEPPGWVTPDNESLLVDLYELTMAQAYVAEGMLGDSVFTLYFRTMPANRNFALACGLADVLRYLQRLHFDEQALERLRSLGMFHGHFLDWLGALRFTGEVYAVPEGTPVFPGEPILEICAPLPQAQLVETMVMNQVHVQTVIASKAARLVAAAEGKPVVDFGLRRTHGADAGLKGARAAYIAGIAATSNVLAATTYGIPASGTMAHSYVQAHDSELEAFRSFVRHVPEATLLVDTYDTLRGVDNVIELARELGSEFRVRAVRIDSGDLGALAIAVRRKLDAAGLRHVGIVASGGLDESRIAAIREQGAPIDAFGVGSELAVSADSPLLDIVYKMAEYRGAGRLKTSPGKETLPGRKQIFRRERDGQAVGDVIARAQESLDGRPLLRQVMKGGEPLPEALESLETIRARAADELACLPERLRAQAQVQPYPVVVSEELAEYAREVRRHVAPTEAGAGTPG
ncbi:MAG TPA: nicotinate phosphoribosyltransferase [Gemmatimonadaceae bacterium]